MLAEHVGDPICTHIHTHTYHYIDIFFLRDQAMLAEHVGDPSMTWSDAREKLREDPRYGMRVCMYVCMFVCIYVCSYMQCKGKNGILYRQTWPEWCMYVLLCTHTHA